MGHGPDLRNPIAATTASVEQGQQLFGIYCVVCHGPEGQGGMPIAAKYPKIPKFTPQLLRQVDDSHMYDMVTNGHGPMPGYAEALAPVERWHVANYLQTLQEK
jgi:mono/diheme cytochrome c family protein